MKVDVATNGGLPCALDRNVVVWVPVCVWTPRVINVTQGVPCITVRGRLLSVGGRMGKSQTASLMARAINGEANKHDLHH